MHSSKRIKQWIEGSVNRSKEHFELCYTYVQQNGESQCVPIAVVGQPDAGIINVEFLLSPDKANAATVLRKVKEEISYYFIELDEADPWIYAQYNCSTASNIYSSVHWSFVSAANSKS